MAAGYWKKIAEQLSDGLEKHTVGTIAMFSSIVFIAILMAKEGGSATVESLITTLMIVGASLMGITSITSAISTNHSKTTVTESKKITSKDNESIEVDHVVERDIVD